MTQEESDRTLKLYERLARFEERTDSIHTLLIDFRGEVRKDREDSNKSLRGHMEEDSITFNAIHATLAGIQNQLTSIQNSNNRIEKEITKVRDEEIKPLKIDLEAVKEVLHDNSERGKWWKNLWVVLTAGVGLGATIVTLIAKLLELF